MEIGTSLNNISGTNTINNIKRNIKRPKMFTTTALACILENNKTFISVAKTNQAAENRTQRQKRRKKRGKNSPTYGSLIRMKTLHMKNAMMTAAKPTHNSRMRFSRGIRGLFTWSRTMNPSPPRVNIKLDARPSMMYWPFTRYGMNATCSKQKA